MPMLVHVVFEIRSLAHLTVIAIFVSLASIEALGYENRLALFASTPEIELSDMNGLGHYLTSAVWFTIYWSTFTVLLLLAAHQLRGRGHSSPILDRIKGWRGELTPAVKWTRVAGLAAMAATGAHIYWKPCLPHAYDST